MKKCNMCPRECAVDRSAGEVGFCGVGNKYVVGSVGLHKWEEPCISGKRGSGAIFFSGCNLRCVFCQNREISREMRGREYGEFELEAAMLGLQELGAHNINLVTPTPYSMMLARTLERVRPKLDIPVVYNCGGYENLDVLRALDGLVDIYLPDLKYFDDTLAREFSKAPNYAKVAGGALLEMYKQTGRLTLDGEGMARRGLIVRHLVLPGHRNDSIAVLDMLAKILPPNEITVSLMRQYTPDFADADAPRELHRRLTDFEYQSVVDRAIDLGFDGFSQERSSATAAYTPKFDIN